MTVPPVNYQPNVPTAKDIFNVTQAQIQQNFKFLNETFNENHVALDALSNAGNHKNIQLAAQTTSQQTNTGEISVYSRDVAGQTEQIFLRYQGNQEEFRLTNFQIYPIDPILNGTTLVQSTYITTLPGNLLVYFGYVATTFVTLNPFVAKKVLTANFCAVDSPSVPPDATEELSEGIITKLKIKYRSGTVGPFPAFYYIVMVNI